MTKKKLNKTLYDIFKNQELSYLNFIWTVLEKIRKTLEEESAAILSHIININQLTTDSKELGEKFLNPGEEIENAEDKRSAMEMAERIDQYLQTKMKEKPDAAYSAYIDQQYHNDIYLVLHRLQSHIRSADHQFDDLIGRFQFVDRVRQQIEHMAVILRDLLDQLECLRVDDEAALQTFIDNKTEWMNQTQSLLSTTEERLAFEDVFGIKVLEPSYDEIFENF